MQIKTGSSIIRSMQPFNIQTFTCPLYLTQIHSQSLNAICRSTHTQRAKQPGRRPVINMINCSTNASVKFNLASIMNTQTCIMLKNAHCIFMDICYASAVYGAVSVTGWSTNKTAAYHRATNAPRHRDCVVY